ncbi:MAG: Gfo/Idh/MocA family oxidoreductase [Verrucomicrobia bacterium]|jgi:predicted dehydrogenase|nr:Gfo/Idh/MocA family oxidoreductase [Verrucomicrobiota bacterium]
MTEGNAASLRVRVAVLGVGSLGQHHARLYAELAAAGVVEFAGVYDTNPQAAEQVARQHRARVLSSLEEAIQTADALSIVTPTVSHHALASDLLKRGRHVLVEKPITNTAAQAAELVRLAQERNLVLQVGHVERFNPVFTYLEVVAQDPRFIETHRLSPYPKRSTDVGVVLDLMIHDLDIVLAFVRSPISSVDAVGVSVLSQNEDIANARLRFENGCVANLTVSRVNPERMRKIRVFSAGTEPSYVSLDYAEQKGYIYRLARSDEKESSLLKKLLSAKDSTIVTEFAGRKIVREPVPITREEPLKLELKHFVDCVRERQQPRVSGAAAQAALEVALEITRQIGSVRVPA